MPLGSKLGGEANKGIFGTGENRESRFLTEKQAGYICKKVETGNLIDKDMIRLEMIQDVELDRIDDTSGDENPYRELIVNNAGRIESNLFQMEQWIELYQTWTSEYLDRYDGV